MDAVEKYIAEHPYIAGGFIVALFLLWFLYREETAASEQAQSTGTTDSEASFAPPTDAQVEASAQLEESQIASQTQLGIAGINAGVSNTAVAGQLQTNLANANVQAQANQINGQVTEAVSALQAQVAEGQTNAGVQTAAIQATAYENIADEPYMAALAEQEVAANVQLAELPTNTDLEDLTNAVGLINNNLGNLANASNYDLATASYSPGGAVSNTTELETNSAEGGGANPNVLNSILPGVSQLQTGSGSSAIQIPIQQLQAPIEFDANPETGVQS